MTQRMQDLADQIVHLQGELGREIEARRTVLRVALSAGLVGFEQSSVAELRAVRMKVSRFLAESSFGATVTAPIIYSLIVPLLLVDL